MVEHSPKIFASEEEATTTIHKMRQCAGVSPS